MDPTDLEPDPVDYFINFDPYKNSSMQRCNNLNLYKSEHVIVVCYVTVLVIGTRVRSNAVADYVLPLFISIGTRVRSTKVADYVLLQFIFYLFFFFFFYSTFVLRNYSTDSHKIFRDCVFWCSLNNPIVLNSSDAISRRKTPKNSENFFEISWVDSDF